MLRSRRRSALWIRRVHPDSDHEALVALAAAIVVVEAKKR